VARLQVFRIAKLRIAVTRNRRNCNSLDLELRVWLYLPLSWWPMDAVAITVGSSWTIAGLLVIALAIPLARGQIGPNALYGVRFPQSFQSDEAWYAINRFGGRRMMIWSIPIVATGIVAFFLPMQANPGLALTLGFAPLAFVLIPVFETWRFAQRLPKE
jgi:hypothetical protein